jgi:hypothetical protein
MRFLPHLLVAAAIVAAVAGIYVKGRFDGSAAAEAGYEVMLAQQAAADAEARRIERAQLEARVATVNAIAVANVEAIERVRTVTEVITRRVEVYVPSDAPALPAGWRLLHDAAARGHEPDPAPAAGTDAAGTSPQDAIRAVIANYGTYHEVAERLTGLQRYVNEVCLKGAS